MTRRPLLVALCLVAPAAAPTAAQAECLGQGCYDGLYALAAAAVAYVLAALVLLILWARGRGRAALIGLAVLAGLGLGVPTASQLILGRERAAMQAREIAGPAPDLSGRTILLITPQERCYANPCGVVMTTLDRPGLHVLVESALPRLRPGDTLDLTSLPVQRLDPVDGDASRLRLRPLTPQEIAAAGIDYVIFTPWHPSFPASGGRRSPVEDALADNPQLRGLPAKAHVTLAMAPLRPGRGGWRSATWPSIFWISAWTAGRSAFHSCPETGKARGMKIAPPRPRRPRFVPSVMRPAGAP
ncbi:MAG: hypothetical protein R3D63_02490 [Paracoccaceae bacterium]